MQIAAPTSQDNRAPRGLKHPELFSSDSVQQMACKRSKPTTNLSAVVALVTHSFPDPCATTLQARLTRFQRMLTKPPRRKIAIGMPSQVGCKRLVCHLKSTANVWCDIGQTLPSRQAVFAILYTSDRVTSTKQMALKLHGGSQQQKPSAIFFKHYLHDANVPCGPCVGSYATLTLGFLLPCNKAALFDLLVRPI